MSDNVHMAVGASAPETMLSHFGFNDAEVLPIGVTKCIMEIVQIMNQNSIDNDTALGLLKSYELRSGQAEERSSRVQNFLNFIKSLGGREDFLASIKNVGLFSKAELEDYARDTGDWGPFLRRVDGGKK